MTGSGDKTARTWDLQTETPEDTLVGHKHWILAVCFSLDSKRIMTGGMDALINVYSNETTSTEQGALEKNLRRPMFSMVGHKH